MTTGAAISDYVYLTLCAAGCRVYVSTVSSVAMLVAHHGAITLTVTDWNVE